MGFAEVDGENSSKPLAAMVQVEKEQVEKRSCHCIYLRYRLLDHGRFSHAAFACGVTF